jgi:hypothetical protein
MNEYQIKHYKEQLLKEGVKFNPVKESCGDLFTVENWIDNVRSGGFIDYDGFGNYAFENEVSNKEVIPSDIKGKMDMRFSHIMWYNR